MAIKLWPGLKLHFAYQLERWKTRYINEMHFRIKRFIRSLEFYLKNYLCLCLRIKIILWCIMSSYQASCPYFSILCWCFQCYLFIKKYLLGFMKKLWCFFEMFWNNWLASHSTYLPLGNSLQKPWEFLGFEDKKYVKALLHPFQILA